MIDVFVNLSPIAQAGLATGFTWAVTALGAALVFFTARVEARAMTVMHGFAAGVMVAASFWSLLAPAIEMAEAGPLPAWIPATVGFLGGGAFLALADRLVPHLHPGIEPARAEGPDSDWHRSTLLVLAITLHNIPEGLAVGVAFGAVAADLPSATLAGALALTLGIGLQNYPEGVAVALPLRAAGLSRLRSFWYGQLSAVVEPLAGLLGVVATLTMTEILPYALSFAAGAMMFVVVEELLPEAQRRGHTDLATVSVLGGFTVMMVLDVALG